MVPGCGDCGRGCVGGMNPCGDLNLYSQCLCRLQLSCRIIVLFIVDVLCYTIILRLAAAVVCLPCTKKLSRCERSGTIRCGSLNSSSPLEPRRNLPTNDFAVDAAFCIIRVLVFVGALEGCLSAAVRLVGVGSGRAQTGLVGRGGNCGLLVVGKDFEGRDEKRGPA